MTSHIKPLRSYRVHLAETSAIGKNGAVNTNDLDLRNTIRVKATDATDALRKAHHVTGMPVIDAVRMEAA